MATFRERPPVVVRVPASSANLGPGFDALGMALGLHAEVGTGPPPRGARAVDDAHPATVAFARAGGHGPLWVRSPIPMGRGLGYSGAVRVGGAVAALCDEPGRPSDDRAERVLEVSAELEGHADNAAASLHGGVVVTAGRRAVRVPLAVDPAIVTWIPDATTSTERSRTRLPAVVPFEDAVFNLARSSLLVAALASGDVDALRDATEDRLHQSARFSDAPASAAALAAGLRHGAWGGWLSGSGPTIALMCPVERAPELAGALPPGGHTKVLRIDHDGAVVRSATEPEQPPVEPR